METVGPDGEYSARRAALRGRLEAARIDLAVVADPDSIAYFAGYWNYLGMDFGRPTILLVPSDGEPTLITPLMESEMCAEMSSISDIRPWTDGTNGEWRSQLQNAIAGKPAGRVAVESLKLHPALGAQLRAMLGDRIRFDADSILMDLRMRKSPAEIAIMRQAGQVAVAMVEGARSAIGAGVPEYEVALAVIAAGSRKAASLLGSQESDRFVSPMIYNLQIMQSGHDTCMVHRRPSTRRIEAGDPVYLCFCGIANFRNYKLGFDREFFVGRVTDEHARIYETTIRAQQETLAAIRPGVTCEALNAVAEAVYREAGFGASYRTGRSIGCSFLEPPELKKGDTTVIEPGMTFAVDGGITVRGDFGGRVGDSIVVTDSGFEYLTPYPRELAIL